MKIDNKRHSSMFIGTYGTFLQLFGSLIAEVFHSLNNTPVAQFFTAYA